MAQSLGKYVQCDCCGTGIFLSEVKDSISPDSWEGPTYTNEYNNGWYHNTSRHFNCASTLVDLCPKCLKRLTKIVDEEVSKIRKETWIDGTPE